MAIKKPQIKKPEINKKVSLDEFTANNINENSTRRQRDIIKERLNRLSANDEKLRDLIKIIQSSNTLYDIFEKYKNNYDDEDDLVVLNIITEEEKQMFNFIYNNDLKNEIETTITNKGNKELIEKRKSQFKQFLVDNPEYSSITRLEDDDLLALPNIYVLGSSRNFEIVNAMSLNTNVKLINNISQLEDFAADNDKKIVLLFEDANSKLSNKYNEIFEEQNFKTYSAFEDNENNSVYPLTRSNLIKTIL